MISVGKRSCHPNESKVLKESEAGGVVAWTLFVCIYFGFGTLLSPRVSRIAPTRATAIDDQLLLSPEFMTSH